MSFLKKLFGARENGKLTYPDFWIWFDKNKNTFFKIVKRNDIEEIQNEIFGPLETKLNQVKEGIYYSVGMFADDQAELILSAEGDVRNVVFVEELVQKAPSFGNWKITALKPSHELKDANIRMEGIVFSEDTIQFSITEDELYPDEINLTFVHQDYDDDQRELFVNGTYVFLDYYIGELEFITSIDEMEVTQASRVKSPPTSISKLPSYLAYRKKEFVEKYDEVLFKELEKEYISFSGNLKSGSPIIAFFKKGFLSWEPKASYPWMLVFEISYDGSQRNGLPSEEMRNQLNDLEENLIKKLESIESRIYVGRQSLDSVRSIFFVCKEFRESSKLAFELVHAHKEQLEISFDLYLDKYWKTFNRFRSE